MLKSISHLHQPSTISELVQCLLGDIGFLVYTACGTDFTMHYSLCITPLLHCTLKEIQMFFYVPFVTAHYTEYLIPYTMPFVTTHITRNHFTCTTPLLQSTLQEILIPSKTP